MLLWCSTSEWKSCCGKQMGYFFFCIVYLRQANWSVRTRYAGGVLQSSKGKRQYQSSLFLFPSPPYHTRSRSLLSVWLCLKTHIISLISSCQDNYSLLSEALGASSDCRATLSLTSIPWRSTIAQHETDGKYFIPDSPGFTFKPSPQSNPLIINFFNDYKCNKKWQSFIDT